MNYIWKSIWTIVSCILWFFIVFFSVYAGMNGICLVPSLLGFLSILYFPYLYKYLPGLNTWLQKKQFFRSLSKEKYLAITGHKICSLPDVIDNNRLVHLKDINFTHRDLVRELKRLNFSDEEIDIILLYISPFHSVKDPYIKGCKFVEKGDYEVALKYFDTMSPLDRNFKIAQKTRQSLKELMKAYYGEMDNHSEEDKTYDL